MNSMPQIVPISEMRLRHKDVLARLSKGPVVLAQHSRAAAVLISLEEWDIMVEDVKRCRRLLLADQRFKDLAEHTVAAVAWKEVERQLAEVALPVKGDIRARGG